MRGNRRGVALLVVVSILTVIGIMGVSFLFSMFLETQASKQFVSTVQARYLAEAGVAHARTLLEEDRLGTRIDDVSEAWFASWVGEEVDVDDDGAKEGKWLLFSDADAQPIGRYAVLVRDEASKVNLNTALADPVASGVDAPNLSTLLSLAGVSNGAQLANEIEHYRYGPDGRPGTASVDDDRDGTVDEADEYQVLALRGDDLQFEGLEELRALPGVDETVLKRLAPVMTVYSTDQNLTLDGKARVNVNTATASEILKVLLDVGVENPWQMAANMADYVDPDLDISHVTKTASESSIANLGDLGDWHWQTDTPSYYRADTAEGQPLVWNATLPVGRFYVLAHGLPGQKVGDVEFAGQTKASVDSGESLGLIDVLGPTTVTVTCHEPIGTSCSFRSLELVASLDDSGLTSSTVRGVEAVRFHELMIAPTIELTVQHATFDGQTSGWICPSSGASCYNSDAGQGRWTWQSPSVPPGQYYVWVYGSQEGQTVGEVRFNAQTELLTHAQRHPATLTVGDDQKITLTIGKTAASGTYYFYKAVLSLQPDAEYVELINLSDKELDVSGWMIEGDAVGGRQARLPAGSIIQGHGLLVAAVDLEDDQAGLAGNGINVTSTWELEDTVSAVQLEFPQGDLTPDSDWLSTAVPDTSRARLVLRYGEQVVDEIEYRLPLETTAPFQSLERGDPSIVRDTDQDGLDDDWYPSLKLYTPGAPNDNEGLRDLEGLEQVVHNPLEEITVLNRPLESIGELAGLPSGVAWTVVAAQDLARLVDRLTVQGLRLETEDHLTAGEAGWRETLDGYESHQQGALGTWQWLDVPDGQYTLSVYGWSGEQVSLRWQQADESYTDWIPTRSTDAQGRIVVGQIGVGGEASPAKTLTLQARCDSTDGVCHLDHVILDPQLTLVGMVNINTASDAVLASLPGMTEAIAQRLKAGRPYGDQDHKARGIGDLLAGSVLGETDEEKLGRFRSLARAITVRSHVFEILSVGEAIERDKPTASQRVRTVVER